MDFVSNWNVGSEFYDVFAQNALS